MKPHDYLVEAASIIGHRSSEYGGVENCFDRIAAIASLVLARDVTPRDVAVIQLCTKLGRLAENPVHHDSYVDGINYLAFAALFAERDMPTPAPVAPAADPARQDAIDAKISTSLIDELAA